MNLDQLIATGRTFVHSYPLLAAVIAVGIVLFAWRSPREFFKLSVLLLILGVVIYFLVQLRGTLSTGASHKERVIHKTREAAGE